MKTASAPAKNTTPTTRRSSLPPKRSPLDLTQAALVSVLLDRKLAAAISDRLLNDPRITDERSQLARSLRRMARMLEGKA